MANVEPFEILEHLGDGGYGSVYRVRHNRWGIVAYKNICWRPSKDLRILKEASEEASRHKNLRDPNIVDPI